MILLKICSSNSGFSWKYFQTTLESFYWRVNSKHYTWHHHEHLGNVQAGAQATYAILHNWTRHNYFSFRAITMIFLTLINIRNAFGCYEISILLLKNKGYTEWRYSQKMFPGSSLGITVHIFFLTLNLIEIINVTRHPQCNFNAKYQLGIVKIKGFLICTYVWFRAQVQAAPCTSVKYAGWCPSHYMLYYKI